MNTRFPNPASLDVLSAKDALQELIVEHNNYETVMHGEALQAIREGRPAYWMTTKYHNGVDGLVVRTANRDGLGAAIRAWAKPAELGSAKTPEAILDRVKPLNQAAVREHAAQVRLYQGEAA